MTVNSPEVTLEAPLCELSYAEDSVWFRSLAGRELTESDITLAGELIAIGSNTLRSDSNPNSDRSTLEARHRFFGSMLGWQSPDHPLHDCYQTIIDKGSPLHPDRIIAGQRLLAIHGIDNQKVAVVFNNVLTFSPESLQEKINLFNKYGIDARKILTAQPRIFGLSAAMINEKINHLTSLGLNATKVVNLHPSATMTQSSEAIHEKLTGLSDQGLEAKKIINRHPVILGFKSESIAEKLRNINELGLDAVRLVNSQPTLLTPTPEQIRGKYNYIQRLMHRLESQWEAADVITALPAALCLSRAKILATATFIAVHGDRAAFDKSPAAIAGPLSKPLESHIDAIVERQYTPTGIAKSRAQIAAPSRRTETLQNLEDDSHRQYLGRACVTAYLRYKPMTTDERKLYPTLKA